jgi:predicted nucleotidyltransferase
MDLSKKIDNPILVNRLTSVTKVANELEIPFFMVGATARDIILWHGFGIVPRRATRDIDLGFRVSSWDQYAKLRDALAATGQFHSIGKNQRMTFQNAAEVDVLPFGEIVDSDCKIKWQPHEDTELSLLGFDEAYANAIPVIISSDPIVEVKIASAAGLVLLKIFAWNDRRPGSKDAIDLGTLIRSYLLVGNEARLWDEHADLVGSENFDLEVAGAHMLGRDLAHICQKGTRDKILEILDRELDTEGDLPLVIQSAASSPQIDRTIDFWEAIRNELRSA